MSLNKEYEELKAIRLKEGEKSREHYNSLDLPGDRKMKVDADEARKRIAAMKKERDAAEQGEVIK